MIGIFVKDLETMVTFYRDVMGLEAEIHGEGDYAEFRHEGIRFSMYGRTKLPELLGQEPTYPSGLNGTFELAIEVAKLSELDDEVKRLVKGGATLIYEPRNEPWNIRSSMIADPEGNLIEIYSHLK
jgi:lactoylglutathione lyase